MSVPTRLLLALMTTTLLAASELGAAERVPPKPRLLVLTDIGGDPDDQQSRIRLMTYANEFEIEGQIASAAGIPGGPCVGRPPNKKEVQCTAVTG